MLFEDFINRHKDNRTADIVFPHIIFPILMIIGVFFILLTPILFMLRHKLFNAPNLGFACTMTGIGFLVGSAGIGATWGLIKEKRSGYRRANYEFLILRNIFFMAVAWPWPFFYGALFFYHYPLQTYQTYIFEMKPTPEVKKEIERLNFLEIKSHTPYDYSLAHQKIRYDFMDIVEYTSFRGKKSMLFYAIETPKKPELPLEKIHEFTKKINLDYDYYPIPFKTSDSYTCAIEIHYNEKPPKNFIEITNKITLTPIKLSDKSAFYDFSSLFYVDDRATKGPECVLRLGKKNMDLVKFWALHLYLPNIHKNVTSIQTVARTQLDFRWKIFLDALDSF